jgi:tripartite-type tricarboxylate transporter receptor subunit TctC
MRAASRPAQPADQFFKGKVINLYIGFAAGGSYDYYARLVARFIGKNIPGNPTVVAQTMAAPAASRLPTFSLRWRRGMVPP